MTGRRKERKEFDGSPPGVEPETAGSTAAAFPIVGIGASAGGLAAFEAFFSGMPPLADPGMAFVLVQHLAPDHESLLTGLVRRYTRMEVLEVADGTVVRPNCAYIIPPSQDMAFSDGTLRLLEPSAPRGHRLPIDFFFRSLAQDQHERAICIVLSGTGSDGTQGVRAVKAAGGMAMAQSPASTEYDGMPQSAIATGLVDFVLPPAEMATQLIAYVTRALGLARTAAALPPTAAEDALRQLFALLRARTGHDFTQYKPSTIQRRIERRMAVHALETLDGYVRFLRRSPAEAEALFRDLLIGVTSFFRDPEAFAALEQQVVPQLFAGKSPGAAVRVWCPGCSTGEEAYSLAILLHERLETLGRTCPVQLFATDIDSQAIATARAGLYPASIAADLSPERLSRFFVADLDSSTYRVHKAIRDLVIFSEQDLVRDPPFSRLDLISCRNLLIYLSGELQKKLLPLFHYALDPGGTLFLGTSEAVGEFGEQFTVLDRTAKLYRRTPGPRGPRRVAPGRLFLPARTAPEAEEVPRAAGKAVSPRRLPLRELTEQALLLQLAPAAALVDGQGDLLYLHGRSGRYLEPAPGEAGIDNIVKMARAGLRRELTMALRQAAQARETVRCPGLRVKSNGGFSTVDLTICPVDAGPVATGQPLYLVVLEERPPAEPPGGAPPPADQAPSPDAETRIAALEQELLLKEQYLQTSNAELESANEELKSANEELQSLNEEQQSTNEELETAKEELQSTNEELATVNTELRTKVADLSRTNNDMNNLLAGTGIATVFVDLQLRILRFTPTATRIVNLLPGDVGRPVGHFVANLVGYDRLAADVQAVLDTLVPRQLEVQATAGAWYTMRILPYRTQENAIEGAVITFVDVSEAKRTLAELRETQAVLARSGRAAVSQPPGPGGGAG